MVLLLSAGVVTFVGARKTDNRAQRSQRSKIKKKKKKKKAHAQYVVWLSSRRQ